MDRELDTWVAKNIFFLRDVDRDNYSWVGKNNGHLGRELIPDYSSDMNEASKVLLKLQQDNQNVAFHLWWDHNWFVERDDFCGHKEQIEYHENPALVICLAAYRLKTEKYWIHEEEV